MRFYRWARSEGLRPDDPGEGIRPPRREPYVRARGLNAKEVARLLAVIPSDSAAGLRLRALARPRRRQPPAQQRGRLVGDRELREGPLVVLSVLAHTAVVA